MQNCYRLNEIKSSSIFRVTFHIWYMKEKTKKNVVPNMDVSCI